MIDRRKNIFKLAQGEYVAPERVEGVYASSPFVSQIFVTGNSLEGNFVFLEDFFVFFTIILSFSASLVAIVVPNEENGMAFARANGLRADNMQQLCKDHTFKVSEGKQQMICFCVEKLLFKEAVFFDLRAQAAKAGLKGLNRCCLVLFVCLALSGFECVLDIFLTTNEFSVQNGILTPTMKIKRPVASRIFQREIAEMYQKKRR